MKRIIRYLGFTLLVLLIGVSVTLLYQHKFKNDTRIDVSRVEEKLTKILELSTARYDYVNVATYKDSMRYKNIKLPFATKQFMIKYGGYIKAGFDMENIDIELTDDRGIKIKLGRPLILDNVVDEEEVYVFDEKSSIFNKLSYNDLYEVLIEEKEKIKEEAINKGLLKEAEHSAQELLESLLETMGFDDIKLVFR